MKQKVNTVGDLLDALAILAKSESLSAVMDSAIYGPNGEEFTSFYLRTITLSDKSEVINFEFVED